MLTVKEIKKFHQEYKRLTLLDHVILLILSNTGAFTIQIIYEHVFQKYKQIRKSELRPIVLKLARLDLIKFEHFLGGYVITKTGIEELKFVEDYLKMQDDSKR